jgi:hypothetical protein
LSTALENFHYFSFDIATVARGLAFEFVAALPTRSALGADGAMDVVVVGACLAHSLETPVGGGGPEEFGVLFGEVAKGSVRGLAAE